MRKSQKPVRPVEEKKEWTRADRVNAAILAIEHEAKSAFFEINDFVQRMNGKKRVKETGEYVDLLPVKSGVERDGQIANTVTYTIRWGAEETMEACALVELLAPTLLFIENRVSLPADDWEKKFETALAEYEEEWTRRLTMQKPWECNSTSAVARLEGPTNATAMSKALEIVRHARRRLNETL